MDLCIAQIRSVGETVVSNLDVNFSMIRRRKATL